MRVGDLVFVELICSPHPATELLESFCQARGAGQRPDGARDPDGNRFPSPV